MRPSTKVDIVSAQHNSGKPRVRISVLNREPATGQHTGAAAEGDLQNEAVKMDYLWESFVPRLAKYGFGPDELKTVLVDNPGKLFAWDKR